MTNLLHIMEDGRQITVPYENCKGMNADQVKAWVESVVAQGPHLPEPGGVGEQDIYEQLQRGLDSLKRNPEEPVFEATPDPSLERRKKPRITAALGPIDAEIQRHMAAIETLQELRDRIEREAV
jgi:hypothetical protein